MRQGFAGVFFILRKMHFLINWYPMSTSADTKVQTLTYLPGMTGSRAALLLELLPELGRLPDSILLGLAGVAPPSRQTRHRSLNASAIQDLLMSVHADAIQDSNSKLGILLRRLRTAHPDEHPRLGLAAILRHCNAAMRRICD